MLINWSHSYEISRFNRTNPKSVAREIKYELDQLIVSIESREISTLTHSSTDSKQNAGKNERFCNFKTKQNKQNESCVSNWSVNKGTTMCIVHK